METGSRSVMKIEQTFRHTLKNGYNWKWSIDLPWHVMTFPSWIWKSWRVFGQRLGDNCPVSHRGFRFMGFSRNEWVVHNEK